MMCKQLPVEKHSTNKSVPINMNNSGKKSNRPIKNHLAKTKLKTVLDWGPDNALVTYVNEHYTRSIVQVYANVALNTKQGQLYRYTPT